MFEPSDQFPLRDLFIHAQNYCCKDMDFVFCIWHLLELLLFKKLFELEPFHTAPETSAHLMLCTYAKEKNVKAQLRMRPGRQYYHMLTSSRICCCNVFNGQ